MTMQNTGFMSQTHLKKYATKHINLIGGPGSFKSVFAAAMLVNIKLSLKSAEFVPEFAKSLVWQKKYDVLKNQYYIAQQQHKMLKLLDGDLQYLITDGSLPQLLFYNLHTEDNICDKQKTQDQILAWYNEFDNINIFIERNPKLPYEQVGRFQSEEEAKLIDIKMENTLKELNIPYTKVMADLMKINQFTNHVILQET